MPNWCQNEVTVRARTKKDINQFIKFVKGIPLEDTQVNPFCLHKIEPMPKELLDNRTSIPGDVPDWYNWRLANWGTKWDIPDCETTHNQHTPDMDGFKYTSLYSFETAWSPPEPIYTILRDKFPALDIDWYYNEPGMEEEGTL